MSVVELFRTHQFNPMVIRIKHVNMWKNRNDRNAETHARQKKNIDRFSFIYTFKHTPTYNS